MGGGEAKCGGHFLVQRPVDAGMCSVSSGSASSIVGTGSGDKSEVVETGPKGAIVAPLRRAWSPYTFVRQVGAARLSACGYVEDGVRYLSRASIAGARVHSRFSDHFAANDHDQFTHVPAVCVILTLSWFRSGESCLGSRIVCE